MKFKKGDLIEVIWRSELHDKIPDSSKRVIGN